jgi:hypothetical protein
VIEEINREIYLCLKIKEDIDILDFCFKNNICYDCVIFNKKELKRGDRILFCVKSGIVYVVKPLDTIKSIADKYGVPPEEILIKNKTKTIFIGQQLYI